MPSAKLGLLSTMLAMLFPLALAAQSNPDDPQGMLPPPPPPPQAFDERLAREHAQTGEVQVSLVWNGPADVDLHVFCPTGEEIYFNSRSHCGGELDIDMNAERNSLTPVENVFWERAPRGRYRVVVVLYNRKGDQNANIPFLVRVKNGNARHDFRGVVDDGTTKVEVTQFTR